MALKRIAALAVAAALACSLGLLASCGQNQASLIFDQVNQEFEQIKTLDDATLDQLVGDAGTADLASYGVDAKEFVRAALSGFDYLVDDVTAERDTAQALVTITHKDLSTFEEQLTAAAEAAADSGDLTLADMNEKLGSLVMDTLNGITATETEQVAIDYELHDGTWTPTEASLSALGTALFA